MKSRITDRGRVTIPKLLRERFGLREGMEVEFLPEETGLRIAKTGSQGHPVDRIFGVLRRPGSTDDYLDEVRGR